MVLDLFLWMVRGTTKGKIMAIIGIFEVFCEGTLASYRGF